MHWRSSIVFKTECERLKLDRLRCLDRLPVLVRRHEVQTLMGWSERVYYRMTKGLRLPILGLNHEQRVPREVIRVWINES